MADSDNKNKGFLPVTRRGFIVGAATTAAVIATPTQASTFGDLRIETTYEPTPKGQKLIGIMVRLSNRKGPGDVDPVLNFRPESFAPRTPENLKMSITRGFDLKRNQSAVISASEKIEIKIEGVDILGNTPEAVSYQFTIFAKTRTVDGKKVPFWYVEFWTNFWRNADGRKSLTFKPVELAKFLALEEGLEFPIGPGWLKQTLPQVLAMPVTAKVNSKIVFRPIFWKLESNDDAVKKLQQKATPDWHWTVASNKVNGDTPSLLGFGDGVITAQMLSFGWQTDHVDGTQSNQTANPEDEVKSRFVVLFPDCGQPEKPGGTKPKICNTLSRNARFEGKVFRTVSGSKITLRAPQDGRAISLTADVIPADLEKGENTHQVALRCHPAWSTIVTYDDQILIGINAAKGGGDEEDADNQIILSNRTDSFGWELEVNATGVTLDAVQGALVDEVSLTAPTNRTGMNQIWATNLGGFEVPVTKTSTVNMTFGAESGQNTKVQGFDMRTQVLATPITLRDVGQNDVFFRALFDQEAAPVVFRLNGVARVSSPIVENGQVWMDRGSAKAGENALDLMTDQMCLMVRRASDMLALDFRFMGVTLRQTVGGFELYSPQQDRRETEIESEAKTPVQIVELPSQHVAEQAYFRRETFGEGLPTVDYLNLVDAYGGEEKPTLRQDVLGAFDTLRHGSREEKFEERSILQGLLAKLFEVANEGTKLQEKTDAEAIRNVLGFQETLRGIVDSKLFIPTDQSLYIGEKFLDPDLSAACWKVHLSKLRAENARKLIGRLLSVENDATFDWINDLSNHKFPPDTQTEAGFHTAQEIGELRTAVVNPLRVIVNLQKSIAAQNKSLSHDDMQGRLMRRKLEVAPDYAAFIDFWREQFHNFSSVLPKSVVERYSEFTSLRTVGKSGDPRVMSMLHLVLWHYSDPTGNSLERYQPRTRARHAAPSRIAFEWPPVRLDDRVDSAREQGDALYPLSLKTLMDWRARKMVVPKRAEVILKRNPEGNILREDDNASILAHQGIVPDPRGQGTSVKRAADIWTSSAQAPTAFETSIELPFRLNLSPSQDAFWVQRCDADEGVFTRFPEGNKGGQTPANEVLEGVPVLQPSLVDQAEPIWTVALGIGAKNPNLRAVWSEDFRPESYLKAFAPKQNSVLDKIYEQPQRGPHAPWLSPKVVRNSEGKLELEEPTKENWATGEDNSEIFRTSLDSYDRDQLVKLTSVYGIPVTGRVDPATKEIRSDAGSFVPPEGYELLDLEVTQVADGESNTAARDVSTIYAPKTLDFTELRLSALGGTLNLDTAFELPMPPRTRDGLSLFPAPTVQRWRQRIVLGRDIRTEIAYKGYLFPFGVRATLIKVTERVYRTAKEARKSPTAFLIQRMYIEIAEPVKQSWYDQPDGGRGWPCDRMVMLTRQTPDLVDPTNTFDLGAAPLGMSETPNGRLVFKEKDKLGDDMQGLVFWPRTAPFASANLPFEFQIDETPDRLQLPMLFVDAEAAQTAQSVARVVDYYNDELQGVDTDKWSTNLSQTSARILHQPSSLRPYSNEISEGDSSYETMAWVLGAEGRPGNRTDPGAASDNQKAVKTGVGAVRQARKKALNARENYKFGPLLAADDQPPFYPFIQFALLRVDRLARLTGQRRGPLCFAAFDADYLKFGLPDPNDPDVPKTSDDTSGLESIFGIMNGVRFDVGKKGDRVGAIGRQAGYLALLARREGPVTSLDRILEKHLCKQGVDAPPEAGKLIAIPRVKCAGDGAYLVPGLGRISDIQTVQSGGGASIKTLLNQILGDDDAKVLGVFKLSEVIEFALATAEDCIPQVSEALDYADTQAGNLLDLVRNKVIQPLFKALDAIDEAFQTASYDLELKDLELRRVYPAVANSLSQLRVALGRLANEKDDTKAFEILPTLPAAGKTLLKALDEVARDPISPVKVELKRLFLDELKDFEKMVTALEKLIALAKDPSEALKTFEREISEDVRDVLKANKATNIETVMQVVPSKELGEEPKRLRYYISHRLSKQSGDKDISGWRLPAKPLEDQISQAVVNYIRQNLMLELLINPDATTINNAVKVINGIQSRQDEVVALINRIIIAPGRVEVNLNAKYLSSLFNLKESSINAEALSFKLPFQTRKRGVETKLIIGHVELEKDRTLIRNLATAHKWLRMIKSGASLDDVAKKDNTSRRRIQQIIAFAFLAPDIVQMILDGRQPIGLTSEWMLRHKLPNDWQDQRALIATL